MYCCWTRVELESVWKFFHNDDDGSNVFHMLKSAQFSWYLFGVLFVCVFVLFSFLLVWVLLFEKKKEMPIKPYPKCVHGIWYYVEQCQYLMCIYVVCLYLYRYDRAFGLQSYAIMHLKIDGMLGCVLVFKPFLKLSIQWIWTGKRNGVMAQTRMKRTSNDTMAFIFYSCLVDVSRMTCFFIVSSISIRGMRICLLSCALLIKLCSACGNKLILQAT